MCRLLICLGILAASAAIHADIPVAWPTTTVKTFTVADAGGRSSYSQVTGRVCYDQEESDDLFDVHCMDLDGTDDVCVTCDHASLDANGQIGNPRISHSGTHMAFQAEDTANGCTDAEAHPGQACGNDIWVMRMDTLAVVKIIDVAAAGLGAAIYCQWDHTDTHIMCGVRTNTSPHTWSIHVYDIELVGDAGVSNLKTYAPSEADAFYEPGAFLPDGRLLFTCVCDNTDTGIDDFDISTFNPKTGVFTQLTSDINILDEHPYPMNNPSVDSRIIWASSRNGDTVLDMDWYIMNDDGSNVQRLTYFHDPNHPMYAPSIASVFGTEWVDDNTFIGSLMISLAGQRPANMYQFDLGALRTHGRSMHKGFRINGR